MRRLAAALLILSCAATPARPPKRLTVASICTTRCGMKAYVIGDCQGFQEAEDRTLLAYEAHVQGWTYAKTCAALKGWNVLVWPEVDAQGSWKFHGLQVLGLSACALKRSFVGTEHWDISALSHELGHAIQCTLDPGKNHRGWTPQGLCAAINEASWLQDDCSDPEYQ